MRIPTRTWSALIALSFAAPAFAGNGSNFQQLMNGMDVFYGGFFNPSAPTGTHGILRCVPSDVLHAPTIVVDPAWAGFTQGTYASKICALHFTALASTGATAIWPNIVLSSSDGDCRFAPGGSLNFGFASTATAFGSGPGFGFFGAGPLNGSTAGTVNVLANVLGASFSGLFSIRPAGATVIGVELRLVVGPGAPSSITVPDGESLTIWMAESLAQGPGNYQYWTGSDDERAICSSLSVLASAIGTPNGAVYPMLVNREFSVFPATLDATLMVGITPNPGGFGGPTMGTANPMDTGTGGRTISLTSPNPATLSFNSYDEGNIFGGSGRVVFANLMGVNTLGAASCGPWSPGYAALPTGGAGGPVLSTIIPQQPRLVGKLDAVAIALATNAAWTLATTHNVTPGGNQYPMFAGFPAAMGGSTGNNGGFAIPIPNLPALVGVQLFFSALGLNATNTAIAKTADEGHTHSNGYTTIFFP